MFQLENEVEVEIDADEDDDEDEDAEGTRKERDSATDEEPRETCNVRPLFVLAASSRSLLLLPLSLSPARFSLLLSSSSS